LRLDERGALLYPNETGPYEPRIRPKAEDDDGEEDAEIMEPAPEPRINLMLVPSEDLEQAELF
jgi:hypothetical protein